MERKLFLDRRKNFPGSIPFRGLATEPKLLLVDEPTEGLMPEMVERIRDSIEAIQREGVAVVVLVEQNTQLALGVTHRAITPEEVLAGMKK